MNFSKSDFAAASKRVNILENRDLSVCDVNLNISVFCRRKAEGRGQWYLGGHDIFKRILQFSRDLFAVTESAA